MHDEIQVAQERLATTLARARAGEDKALSKQVREVGEQFARLLYGVLRMTRIHSLENKAFHQPLEELTRILGSLCELLGTVHLICVEDQVYVNDVRIRFDMSADHVHALGEDLRRHGVGGISFNEPLKVDQCRTMVSLLMARPPETSPRRALQANLEGTGLGSVELQGVFRFRLKGEQRKEASRAYKEIYQQSAGVIAEAFGNMASNRLPNPLPVRRLVNEIIDATKEAGSVELAREQEGRIPPVARHTLMVGNLTLMLGRAAGLSDATLGDLGVTAMFHDVGLSMKEDGYDVPFDRHSAAGLRALLRQRGFHEAKVRRLLAIIEHHRSHAGPKGRPSLFARIIHIADDYDILTRYRPGEGPVLAPPDALSRMLAQGGEAYDPQLLALFVNHLGKYPPGTIMRLRSGRLVVSMSGVRSPETFATPLCRVVRDADGERAPRGATVDLALDDGVAEVVKPT